MKSLRKQLINWLFEKSMMLYCRFKRKQPWGISAAQLLELPKNTFGHHLGSFLTDRGFQLIPKVERHDAYHMLTGYNTTVEDEIALQFACFGNGKRTPYLLGVLFLGTLIIPEDLSYYLKAYRFGKKANSFHHFDFKQVLNVDYQLFVDTLFSEVQKEQIRIRKSSQIIASMPSNTIQL